MSADDARTPDPVDDELLARLNEERPETLRLEPGETFVGTYVRREKGHTDGWGEKWIMVLADSQGRLWSLWLLHTVLIDELCKLKPKPGDRLGFKYLGKVKPKSGKGPGFHAWRVVAATNETQQHTWDHITGDADEDADDRDARGAVAAGRDTHRAEAPSPAPDQAAAAGERSSPAPAATATPTRPARRPAQLPSDPADSQVWTLFKGRCQELRITASQARAVLCRLGGFLDLRTNDWPDAVANWDLAKWADADQVLTERFSQLAHDTA
jgi:hypothetical protein